MSYYRIRKRKGSRVGGCPPFIYRSCATMWFRLLRKCSTFPRCVYMRAFYSVPLVLGAFELPPQPGDLPFEFAVLRRQRSAPPQGRRDAAEEVRPLPRSLLLH